MMNRPVTFKVVESHPRSRLWHNCAFNPTCQYALKGSTGTSTEVVYARLLLANEVYIALYDHMIPSPYLGTMYHLTIYPYKLGE